MSIQGYGFAWRLARFSIAGIMTVTLFCLGHAAVARAADPVLAGYRDFSFPAGTSGDSMPTGEKPESKLWWNDGLWWGILWSTTGNAYHSNFAQN